MPLEPTLLNIIDHFPYLVSVPILGDIVQILLDEVTIALILAITLHKLLQLFVSEEDDIAFDEQCVSEIVEVVIEGSLED